MEMEWNGNSKKKKKSGMHSVKGGDVLTMEAEATLLNSLQCKRPPHNNVIINNIHLNSNPILPTYSHVAFPTTILT